MKTILRKVKTLSKIIIALMLARIRAVMIFYQRTPQQRRFFDLTKRIKKESGMLMEYYEAYQIYMAVSATDKIEGDIAEVGVYTGGSAKIICDAKKQKALHLFDTFDGLPDLSKNDRESQFSKGQFKVNLKYVKEYLKGYRNVYFYKGLFPGTAKPVKNKKFSFVNLDVDLYQSTKDCLKFFYCRMNKCGIIISHDYQIVPGVQKAFDEFFKNKPESIIKLHGSQCMIVKAE